MADKNVWSESGFVLVRFGKNGMEYVNFFLNKEEAEAIARAAVGTEVLYVLQTTRFIGEKRSDDATPAQP